MSTKTRRRTYYVAPDPMADSIWIRAQAALDHVMTCHDDYSDCHPTNHPQWERVALMRLRQGIAAMLADVAERREAAQ